MRRKTNPLSIIFIVIGVIAGLIVGLLVKNTFFAESRFGMLVFWGIFIGCGAVGAVIGSAFRNKR